MAALAALGFHASWAWQQAGGGSAAADGSSAADLCAATVAAEEAPSSPGWTISAFGSDPASQLQRAVVGSGSQLGDAGAKVGRAMPRRHRWLRLAAYLLPRAAPLVFFGAWAVALPASGSYQLHLHHYAVGWAAASFACFNHPVSGLLLAIGTAVFVQVRERQ